MQWGWFTGRDLFEGALALRDAGADPSRIPPDEPGEPPRQRLTGRADGRGPVARGLGRRPALGPVPARAFAIFTTCAIFTHAVNKQQTVNIKGPLEPVAARVLRNVPGLAVTLTPGGRGRGVDAIIAFKGGRATPVAVEVRRNANAATAWQLVHYGKDRLDRRLLLIADTTTAEARKILGEHGIAIIDGIGNAHIELPGLLFHLEGHAKAGRTVAARPPTRLRGKAGVVAQALLLEPERAWQIKGLAERAQASVGLVHRVVTRLDGERLMTTEGAGPNRVRRLTDPTALLDLWAEETSEQPIRTLAYRLAQTPRQLIRDVGHALADAGLDYALTGAAAGTLVAPFITAVPIVEAWVAAAAAPEELLAAAGATPAAQGHNLVFLQAKDDAPLAFRMQADEMWVANRFRLYADLRRDPRRGREQADHLRREMIGF